MQSTKEAAIGLSMNTGLPAFKTGCSWSQWTRPSLDSSNTASTFCTSASTESTISTPKSRTFSVYSGTRLTLLSISKLPCGYAATTRTPATFGASSAFFGPLLSVCVNARTWDVSNPMMPTLIWVSAPSGCAADSPKGASQDNPNAKRIVVLIGARGCMRGIMCQPFDDSQAGICKPAFAREGVTV